MGVAGSPDGVSKVVLPQKSRGSVLNQMKGWGYHAESYDSTSFGTLPGRLKRYLSGESVDFPDRLDLSGATYFQRSVWQIVRAIPYGETRSYAWVASQLGSGKSARAVGQAMAGNPLPILVPCHRVVGSNGKLGGFRDGVEMKKYLLNLEAACLGGRRKNLIDHHEDVA